jgi:hypothetical protein
VPTDHVEPKQKDFKLLIRLSVVRCVKAQSLHQSFASCAADNRDKPSEIFILLDRKWSVGIAHPASTNILQHNGLRLTGQRNILQHNQQFRVQPLVVPLYIEFLCEILGIQTIALTLPPAICQPFSPFRQTLM